MKYAILNPRNAIVRVENTQPQNVIDRFSVVEISDEIAATVESGRTATPQLRYFYEGGHLMTLQEKMQQRHQGIGLFTSQSPLAAADQWIERQGFSALKVIALMDIEGKLATASKSSGKLTAVRSWLDGITASFALNPVSRDDWPTAPFRFEETVQEAITILNQ
jgi:hypothetical protein